MLSSDVTPFGIDIEVTSDEEKAECPRVVSKLVLPNVTAFIDDVDLKALLPILTKESGPENDTRPDDEKANCSIVVSWLLLVKRKW